MLSPAKEQFAVLISQGKKQAVAIRELGRTPQTAVKWMRDPAIVARVKELRENLTDEAMRLLRDSVVDNTRIVLDIARNGGEPGVVPSRLKAATWALEHILLKPQKQEGPHLSGEDLDHLLERGET